MLTVKKQKATYLSVITLSYILTMVLIFCGLYFLVNKQDKTENSPLTYIEPGDDGILSGIIPQKTEPQSMKAIWVATVSNINFPSARGLSEGELKRELADIVSNALSLGANAVFFQVRPCGDALYESGIFPYSHYASGERGVAPDGGLDILEYLIDIAHSKGIEVHAWVNPVRLLPGSPSDPARRDELCAGESAAEHPEWAVLYADGRMYYDIGIPAVRNLIADGVSEIVSRYDVDGIVFDDYFYPYPVTDDNSAVAVFNDLATYTTYGGGISLSEFRRDSVRALVRGCSIAIKRADRECKFGISPFGVWKNAEYEGGAGTAGLESYYDIYCDSLSFAIEGWVDYIAPQLYWEIGNSACDYYTLAHWWSRQLAQTDCTFIPCLAPYRYEEGKYTDGEITRQIKYARTLSGYGGAALYGYSALTDSSLSVGDEIRELWK